MYLDDHVRAIEKKLDMFTLNRASDMGFRNVRRPTHSAYNSNIQMARRVQSMQEREREDSADVISLYGDDSRVSKHRTKNLTFEDDESAFDRNIGPSLSALASNIPAKPKPDVDLLA